MDDLVTWLRARLDDDEQGLRTWLGNLPADSGAADWVRQWLTEVEAKRRVLAWAARAIQATEDDCYQLGVDDIVRLLAVPYADRPGHREEWQPAGVAI